MTLEERLTGEEFDDYYFQFEIGIIRSLLIVNESFKSLLTNQLRYLTRLGARASEPDLNIPLDRAWKFSQLLADFDGGQEELDARCKVLQAWSPSLGIDSPKSAESLRAATETSTIEDEGFVNSRAPIERKAALIVAREEEAARENYLSERGSALALIKTTEGEEKQEAISILTDIEFKYPRTYSKFERGIRLQQLTRQLSIEEQKRQSQRQKLKAVTQENLYGPRKRKPASIRNPRRKKEQ